MSRPFRALCTGARWEIFNPRCFRCGRLRQLAGSQVIDGVEHLSQALGLCTSASGSVIRVLTHPRFVVWAPRLLIGIHTYRGTLGMCAQATGSLIRVGAQSGLQVCESRQFIEVRANWALGVCWGCLSGINSPGAEGVRVQEAMAAVESSLTSR